MKSTIKSFIKLQNQIVYKGTNKFIDIYKNVKTPVSVYLLKIEK